MLIKITPVNKIEFIIKRRHNIGLHRLHNPQLLDNNTVLIKNLLLTDMLLIHNQLCHPQMLEKSRKPKGLRCFQFKLRSLNNDNLIKIRKTIFHLPTNRLSDLLANPLDLNPTIFLHKMTESLRLILEHRITSLREITIIIILLIITKDMLRIKI